MRVSLTGVASCLAPIGLSICLVVAVGAALAPQDAFTGDLSRLGWEQFLQRCAYPKHASGGARQKNEYCGQYDEGAGRCTGMF